MFSMLCSFFVIYQFILLPSHWVEHGRLHTTKPLLYWIPCTNIPAGRKTDSSVVKRIQGLDTRQILSIRNKVTRDSEKMYMHCDAKSLKIIEDYRKRQLQLKFYVSFFNKVFIFSSDSRRTRWMQFPPSPLCLLCVFNIYGQGNQKGPVASEIHYVGRLV